MTRLWSSSTDSGFKLWADHLKPPTGRRVVIEDDFVIQHESWGSAVLPRTNIRIEVKLGDFPFPALPMSFPFVMEQPKHTCPLTEAKPGTAMLYACPVCSGINC